MVKLFRVPNSVVLVFAFTTLFFFSAILNPRNLSEKPKSFNFDYSYWSHDEVRFDNNLSGA